MSVLNCFLLLSFIAVLDAARFKCDYTHYKAAGGYLKFQRIPLSFRDARLKCAAEGAVLASPMNDGIKSAMIGIMNDSKVECAVMTGIVYDNYMKGVYYSIEGVPLDEVPHTWAPGEPDNHKNEENCIVMLTDGTIADVRCSEPFPYFCFMKPDLAKKLNQCGPENTDYSYDPKTGSCYKFHRTGRVYDDAANACVAERASLLIINSETEAKAMSNLFSKNPGGFAFIGFRYFEKLRLWMTLQGETITDAGYDKWAPGEPNNITKNQNCGGIYRSGFLDDIECNEKYVYICEKDPAFLLCN